MKRRRPAQQKKAPRLADESRRGHCSGREGQALAEASPFSFRIVTREQWRDWGEYLPFPKPFYALEAALKPGIHAKDMARESVFKLQRELDSLITWGDDDTGGFYESSIQEFLIPFVIGVVDWINELAEKDPDLWRGFAECYPVWPVLLSEHPSRKRRAKEILTRLNVGGKHLPRADKRARSDIDRNPFAFVALQLLRHVREESLLARAFPRARKPFRRAASLYDLGFSRDTWPKWWAVAREALLEAYPHPEDIDLLANHIKGRKSVWDRMPSRIIDELKEEFQKLAFRAPPAPPI
jgi:hypothetical protein